MGNSSMNRKIVVVCAIVLSMSSAPCSVAQEILPSLDELDLRETVGGFAVIRRSDGRSILETDAHTASMYRLGDGEESVLVLREGWESGWNFNVYRMRNGELRNVISAPEMEATFAVSDFDGDGKIDFAFYKSQQEFSNRIVAYLMPRVYYARQGGFELGGWPCGSAADQLLRQMLSDNIERLPQQVGGERERLSQELSTIEARCQ
jgi:hypothetical protein